VVVTRYDGVEFVGTHPELFSAQLDDSPVDRTFGSPAIITVDGELRHELRHALDAKYRPRHVRAYIDDLVRPIAAGLLDGLGGRDRAELMADYLEPLSVLSLGSVLGVACLGAHGDDSTIAHLLHSGMPVGSCRPRDFVMPTLKVILLGGMQEPGHGAGSTLAGLLSEPSQLAAAQADPGLLPAVVEEGLRWVSPIGTHTRQVAAGTELAGVRLPQGAASHADPRTTMRYDRARGSLDRHATYIVAAYLAGAAR
jgi:cytochrome P450